MKLLNAKIRNKKRGAAFMAQSVKHLALDFGSGQDLMVRGSETPIKLFTDGEKSAWDFLSLPVSLPLPSSCKHVRALSLSQNK